MRGAPLRAFIALGADRLGRFQLDEGLQHDLHGIAEHIHVAAGTQRVQQVGQGRLVKGDRLCSPS